MDSQSLHTKASQETFISLLQLDPSPIESPQPDAEKELPPLPEETAAESSASSIKTAGTAGSVGLSSHGGRSAVFYLTRIQRYSTYALSIFTTLHLTTTSITPLLARSVPGSESYLLLAREIYQTPFSEPLLVGLPIVAHVASGIALRLIRRQQNLRWYGGATPGMHALHHARTGHSSSSSTSNISGSSHGAFARWRVWPPLSYISASGYGFALLLGAHVFMNRALPLLVEGDSANIGLAYVAHGFARHPLVSWASYVGLLGVGVGHMVWGWARWLGLAQKAGWAVPHPTGNAAVDKAVRKRRRRAWLAIHGVAAAAAGLWAAGGLGVVARGGLTPGWVGNVYDKLYASVWL